MLLFCLILFSKNKKYNLYPCVQFFSFVSFLIFKLINNIYLPTEQYEDVDEGAWYFFTPREKKYPNGARPRRSAGDGYWKATGSDKDVVHNNVVVGFRKSLVFYRGKPSMGKKTDWMMHEFKVNDPSPRKQGRNNMRV